MTTFIRKAARHAATAVLIALAVGGRPSVASSPSAAAKEDISLVLKNKIIRNLSSSGLTLAFEIAVTNKATAERELVRYRYRVVVNQKEFLNMSVPLDQPLAVPARRDTLIALPVKITYALLFEAVGPLEDKAQCDIVGELVFADERRREEKVGFAYPGEFPIFKDPEVDFPALKLNDLSVGGADIVFRARFKNPNNYDLLVDRISFRLLVGPTEVLSGLVPGEKSLPRTGERVFSLPVLVDFFETGKEMRDLFQKPEIPCRLEGGVEIASVWGPLVIRFDKSQTVAIER